MNVRIIALLAALLPLVAVHATYLVAAGHGLVDWCNPYIDGCTSISATGRKPPASYLFRATMLPAAVILALYWWFNHAWVCTLWRRRGVRPPAMANWMLALGLVACAGLVAYVAVLGERGDAWALLRRSGVVLYFALTYLAQFTLVVQLRRLAPPGVSPAVLAAIWWTCVSLLCLGLLTVALDAWNEAWYDRVEDAFEWVLALLLQVNFALGYVVWRQADWRLEVVETGYE